MGIFQDVKASNFVRSKKFQYDSVNLEFVNKVTDNDKISTLVISERSFDFGNLLTLRIYIFRLLLF